MRAPLERLTPVTDEMLRNPPPGDWLHWRSTYDGWAHSPLTQINRNTVKNLKVAWTWSLASPKDAVKSERTYNSGPLVITDKVLVGAGQLRPGKRQSGRG